MRKKNIYKSNDCLFDHVISLDMVQFQQMTFNNFKIQRKKYEPKYDFCYIFTQIQKYFFNDCQFDHVFRHTLNCNFDCFQFLYDFNNIPTTVRWS